MDADSITLMNKNGDRQFIAHSVLFRDVNFNKDTVNAKRNSSTAIFANRIFPFRGHKKCVLIQYQHDAAYPEKGIVEIVSLDTKEVLHRLQLPSGAEMQPVINDVNQDGKLDVLINCYDGNTYCYSLGE